jgi:hypothetical protein
MIRFQDVSEENHRLLVATGKLPTKIAMNSKTCIELSGESHSNFFGIDTFCGLTITLDETLQDGHFELFDLVEVKKDLKEVKKG